MNRKYVILLMLLLTTQFVFAQIGGLRSFEFLEIPNHAKVAALGTVNITAAGGDVNMVNQNPALLDSLMDNQFSLSISPYFADIINSQVNYAKYFDKIGIIHFGVYYQRFGTFRGYDNTGQTTSDFSVGNYLISLAHSKSQGVFSYGAALKIAGMQFPNQQAAALLFDLGGIYKHPDTDFTAGMTLKNIGVYLAKDPAESRNLPFDIQLGSTFKPEFMPFRFSLTINRLYKYDLSYFEPVIIDEGNPFSESAENKPTTFDKLFQHLTIGTELILGKSLTIQAGYNHLLRESLRRTETAGAGGFTFGLNFRTKKINLAYANALYQLGGSAHFISVGTNFNAIMKRKDS